MTSHICISAKYGIKITLDKKGRKTDFATLVRGAHRLSERYRWLVRLAAHVCKWTTWKTTSPAYVCKSVGLCVRGEVSGPVAASGVSGSWEKGQTHSSLTGMRCTPVPEPHMPPQPARFPHRCFPGKVCGSQTREREKKSAAGEKEQLSKKCTIEE